MLKTTSNKYLEAYFWYLAIVCDIIQFNVLKCIYDNTKSEKKIFIDP